MPSTNLIVTFKDDTPHDIIEQQILAAEAAGAKIVHRYNSAIKGFSIEVPDESVSAMSLRSPHIQSVEPDGEVTTQGKSLIKSE
ncbi:hypothetical protein G6F37_002417 [Rhizopus arrhizus]|nr:hypothetical protein G6F38_002648 [Rhizopus arrhizus]KAG1162139.1 hypothetical protein G6F37_002417 [Rhizopus arrhizus]